MLQQQITGRESFIHRLMPITKLVAVILFWLTALISVNIGAMILMICVSLSLWIIAKIPLKPMKPVFISTGFILIIFSVLNGFFNSFQGKTALFYVFGFPFWKEGLIFGIAIWLKLLCVVTIFPVLTLTTPLPLLLASLAKLKLPYKIVFSLGMAFRLTPMVGQSFKDITESQVLRGHDPSKMNYIEKLYKGYLPLFIPLMMTLLRRSGDLDIAIESRGFGAPVQRSYLVDVKTTWLDWVFLTIFSLGFVAIIYIAFFTKSLSMIYYYLK
jgi:energy-coupling factor transport system permease protein